MALRTSVIHAEFQAPDKASGASGHQGKADASQAGESVADQAKPGGYHPVCEGVSAHRWA